MKKSLVLFLVLQLFVHHADQIPVHSVSDEASYAKEIIGKLMQNSIFRDILSERLGRSLENNKANVEKRAPGLNPSQSRPSSSFLILNVSENWFLLHKWKFLKDLETLIRNHNVKCGVAEIHSTPSMSVLVEYFCYYKEHNKITKEMSYVPSFKLKKLLEGVKSKMFMQQYNISTPIQKIPLTKRPASLLASFFKSIWFPITTGVIALIFFIVIGLIVLSCFRKRKHIEEGEKVDEGAFSKSSNNSQDSFESFTQSNTTPSKNSYAVSPKKHLFSYSPNKFSTPVFSFTSPTKYKDKLIYPSSPIETAPPLPIQPSLGLLYPSSLNSPSIRKSSGNSTGNSTEKSRTPSLLQSRRGSSASLIIDVSPRTPPKDLSLNFPPSHESPTEEILQRKSRCLHFNELRLACANDKELHEEFWGIPPNTVGRKDVTMKYSLKNRYPDILPNARSIVSLKGQGRRDSSSKYINANFIRGYEGIPDQFIATQGPLPCTAVDFWHMVWQYKATAIIMITKLKEKNREKCSQYWPSPLTAMQCIYGGITVTYESEKNHEGYSVTTLNVSHKGFEGETRKIRHYWFIAWPDHHVPKSCGQVLSLAREVLEYHQHSGLPIVVHCSAGRGRTGCFIAIYNGIVQINEDKRIDVLKIVSRMRMQRGGMVAKDHQYKFIYDALYEYWSNKLQCSPTSSSRFSLDEGIQEERSSDIDDDDDYGYRLGHAFSFTE